MAGNLLQVGSDGKLRVKSDGIVVAGSSDPCCCTGPCGCLYTGAWTLTLAGVVFCQCVKYIDGFGGTHWIKFAGTANGTYCLAFVSGSDCDWTTTPFATGVATNIVATDYGTDATCTTAVATDAPTVLQAAIRYTPFSNILTLRVNIVCGGVGFDLFNDLIHPADGTMCANSYSFGANGHACGDASPSNIYVMSAGGATITRGGC